MHEGQYGDMFIYRGEVGTAHPGLEGRCISNPGCCVDFHRHSDRAINTINWRVFSQDAEEIIMKPKRLVGK